MSWNAVAATVGACLVGIIAWRFFAQFRPDYLRINRPRLQILPVVRSARELEVGLQFTDWPPNATVKVRLMHLPIPSNRDPNDPVYKSVIPFTMDSNGAFASPLIPGAGWLYYERVKGVPVPGQLPPTFVASTPGYKVTLVTDFALWYAPP